MYSIAELSLHFKVKYKVVCYLINNDVVDKTNES